MKRWRWLWVPSVVCLLLAGCESRRPKKPDPTKGTVTGIVICTDTGKPARFATVTLSAAPKKGANDDEDGPLPETESTVTDLDGRFRLEAVEPGRYYAFTALEGYADPVRGLDFARIADLPSGYQQHLDSIRQWKDHLTEVTVAAHRSTEVSLQVERGAEIGGTVTFDDGSPAIGLHFQLLRKTDKGAWSEVGVALLDGWNISSTSDGRGRFNLTGLAAGEYIVCALAPIGSQDSAPRICLGNTFRRKDATIVKVHAGESASGADIVIPLGGLHSVAGTVSTLADGHAVGHGKVRLLYADDREKARETTLLEDGSFRFEYVPEGKYIVQVSVAQDQERRGSEAGSGNSETATGAGRGSPHNELPVTVQGDVDDLQIQLPLAPPDKPATP